MTYTDPAAIGSIRNVIRSEQNYVFACGLAGAKLTGGARRRAVAQIADRGQRIQILAAMITELDVPTTPPGFVPPVPIDNARGARSSLVQLNNALVGTYAQMAASTEGADRAIAVAGAQDCARTAVQWGGTSQAFPTSE
jgi:hypothetical protein